jgi:hypothetical protein
LIALPIVSRDEALQATMIAERTHGKERQRIALPL